MRREITITYDLFLSLLECAQRSHLASMSSKDPVDVQRRRELAVVVADGLGVLQNHLRPRVGCISAICDGRHKRCRLCDRELICLQTGMCRECAVKSARKALPNGVGADRG